MKHYERAFLCLSLVAALVAALGLTACGRKGPLDPPPGASLAGQPTTADGEPQRDRRILGPDGKPIASGNTNKRIPLDVLLN